MDEKRNDANRQQGWRSYTDAVLLLNGWKLLAALLVWGGTAVYTWLIADSPDPYTGILPLLIVALGTTLIPLYLIIAPIYTLVRKKPHRRYLTLNRYTLLLLPAFIAGVLLHNIVYAMFYPYYLSTNGDEGVFFIAALLGIPIYFLAALLNTIRRLMRPAGSH